MPTVRQADVRALPPVEVVLRELCGWDAVLRTGDTGARRKVLAALIEQVTPLWVGWGRYRAVLTWTPVGAVQVSHRPDSVQEVQVSFWLPQRLAAYTPAMASAPASQAAGAAPDETRQDLTALLEDLPRQRSMLLPALQRVQAQLGFLPLWAQEAVGEYVRVPKSEVYGVVTHYPDLRSEAPGRHVVRVCTGLSCQVVGASATLAALEQQLGLSTGQTTADGLVSLEETHCAFVCGVAPVIEIDGVPHAGLAADDVLAMVQTP